MLYVCVVEGGPWRVRKQPRPPERRERGRVVGVEGRNGGEEAGGKGASRGISGPFVLSAAGPSCTSLCLPLCFQSNQNQTIDRKRN